MYKRQVCEMFALEFQEAPACLSSIAAASLCSFQEQRSGRSSQEIETLELPVEKPPSPNPQEPGSGPEEVLQEASDSAPSPSKERCDVSGAK